MPFRFPLALCLDASRLRHEQAGKIQISLIGQMFVVSTAYRIYRTFLVYSHISLIVDGFQRKMIRDGAKGCI